MHTITVADIHGTPRTGQIHVGRADPGDTFCVLQMRAGSQQCLVLLDYRQVTWLIGNLATIATQPNNTDTWENPARDEDGYQGPTLITRRPRPGGPVTLIAGNPAVRAMCQVQLDPAALTDLITHLGAYLADG